MEPSCMMCNNFLLEISNGIWLVDLECVLVENCDDEVLRRSYEVLVGQ